MAASDETTPLIHDTPKQPAFSHAVVDEENNAVLPSPSKPPVEVSTSVGSIIAVLLLGTSRPKKTVESSMLSFGPSGEFISNADSTLIMTATARISSEFNRLQGAAWLSTGYMLGVCVAQPMVGYCLVICFQKSQDDADNHSTAN